MIAESLEREKAEDFYQRDVGEIQNDYIVYDLDRPKFLEEYDEYAQKTEHNPKSGTFLSPNIISDDSYWDLIQSLNINQREFLLGVVSHVKSSNNPFYYFLTGGAGTGKSLLISAIYQTLYRWFNRNGESPDDVKVLLTGPTGKSAFNIRGTTIHTALGIPVTQNSILKNMSDELKNTYRKKLWKLKAIIIDEVSMVGSSTLRKIDHQLKQIFCSEQAFAGISILFVGDFNQLKPVMDSYIFNSGFHAYSELAGTSLWHSVKYYRLNEIMRQKDDIPFANALNNLALGDLNSENKLLFESRLFQKDSPHIPKETIWLFPTNIQVERHNESILNSECGQCFESKAYDYIASGLSKRIRDQALYSISFLEYQKTYIYRIQLKLKLGLNI